jgi:WhiB family redox-sensing transcriptional regulator
MGRPPSLPPVDVPAPQQVPPLLLDGACAEEGSPDLFFEDGNTQAAKEVCASCPLATACLDYAFDNEEFGVWGGTTPEERQAIRGGAVLINIEVRQRAAELRVDLVSGATHDDIARKWHVSTRTVERAARTHRKLRAA